MERNRPAGPVKRRPNQPCPCGSGRKFKRCCRPIIQGQPAPTPEALMRSRYTAYALGQPEHIIATTDPTGPMWEPSRADWTRRIRFFCAGHVFEGLEVIAATQDAPDRAHVHFRVHLTRDGEEDTLDERSLFLRRGGRWLYTSGEAP